MPVASESSSLRLETPLLSVDETLLVLPTSSPEASKCHNPHLSPSRRPPELLQDHSISVPFEVTTAPASPTTPSISPQCLLGVTPVDPHSLLLYLALAPTSLTSSQEGSLENKVSSTPAPRPSFVLHPPHSSSSSSVDVNFAFSFVTLTVLVSALSVVLAIIRTHSRKSWAKNEDINSHRNSTTKGNTFNLTQQLRHTQYTARPARLVFNPGGLVLVPSSHEDARKRMWETHNTAWPLSSTLVPCLPHFILGYYFLFLVLEPTIFFFLVIVE
jgi:hypothetical protein